MVGLLESPCQKSMSCAVETPGQPNGWVLEIFPTWIMEVISLGSEKWPVSFLKHNDGAWNVTFY